MEYKIYIQSFNGWPIADWAVSAYMGFREKQANIIFFEDIEEVPKSRNNIVIAYIEETRKYFDKLGIEMNYNFSIPRELEKYCGRAIEYMTLGQFKEDTTVPIFVKPVRTKYFVAGVITKQENKEYFFTDVPDDTPVLVSEVVDFVSEYRCYVIDGELKGIKHYMGDFRVFPNTAIIDFAITDFTTAPAGYAIDFGVTRDGRTLLIECNDGWGLGNYGLNDTTYSTLLAKRWLQIMKQNSYESNVH